MKMIIRRFTLIELLAAMSVFSVLLLVCMRIFSGAQTMWVRSEQKNNAFADVRSAMEFISSKLQTVVCSDGMPFKLGDKITGSTNSYASIYFATAMPMTRKVKSGTKEINLDDTNIRFVSFMPAAKNTQLESSDERVKKGALLMLIYSDRNHDTTAANRQKRFPLFFPPYDNNPLCASMSEALSRITTGCQKGVKRSSPDDGIVIIERVAEFKMMPYAMKASTYTLQPYNNLSLTTDFAQLYASMSTAEKNGFTIVNVPPFVLEIEMTVLDTDESYEKWRDSTSDSEKSEIVQEHGYTFRRAVVLCDPR